MWYAILARSTPVLLLILAPCFICTRFVIGPANQKNASSDLVGEPLLMLKHFARVDAAIYSPDGKYIASAGTQPENWIRIWDSATGKNIRILKGHTSFIRKLRFSPDGKQLISSSFDKTFRIWDFETGKELFRLDDQGEALQNPAFALSPDGKLIVTSGPLGAPNLRVFSTSSGKEIRRFQKKTPFPNSLAFSPDGAKLITGNIDNTATIYDFENETCLQTLPGEGDLSANYHIEQSAFSPDGATVVICGGALTSRTNGFLKLIDASSGSTIRTFSGHDGPVYNISFSPDGKKLASAAMDGLLKVWDLQSGKELSSFKITSARLQTGEVVHVSFSPDGKQILTSGGDKYVRVWDTANVKQLPAKSPVPFLAVNGSLVVDGEKPTRFLRSITCLAISPDDKRVVSGASDGEIKVWDLTSGEEVLLLQSHQLGLAGIQVNQVSFSPDGRWIVSGSGDGKIKVWNAESGELIRTIEERLPGLNNLGPVLNFAFNNDGTKLTAGYGWPVNAVRVWETATGKELSHYQFEKQQLDNDNAKFFAFAPNKDEFIVTLPFKSILFDAQTGVAIREIDGAKDNSTTASFSVDGELVVSAQNSQIVITEVASGKQLRSIAAPVNSGVSSSAAWSPDGKLFATGGHAGSLSIWDVESGRELVRNFDEIGPITSVSFSKDGKTILTGSKILYSDFAPVGTAVIRDGELQVWDSKSGELIRTLRRKEPQLNSAPTQK